MEDCESVLFRLDSIPSMLSDSFKGSSESPFEKRFPRISLRGGKASEEEEGRTAELKSSTIRADFFLGFFPSISLGGGGAFAKKEEKEEETRGEGRRGGKKEEGFGNGRNDGFLKPRKEILNVWLVMVVFPHYLTFSPITQQRSQSNHPTSK